MSMVSGFFFPWRNTFRRLELEQRWWHRLALVLFFAALIFLLFAAWFLTMNGTEPTNTVLQNTRYWYVDGTGNHVDLSEPPQGSTAIAPEAQDASNSTVTEWDASGKPIHPASHPRPEAITGKETVKLDMSKASAIHAEVDMPSGEAREFVGKSPKEIKAEWDKTLRKARLNQVLLSLGVAVVAALVFSYLLQSLYRALLYVSYGSLKKETS
jgi:hypothetical protein